MVAAFLGLVIIQRSFLWSLPQPFSGINIALVVLMSYLMFSDWSRAWLPILVFGLLFDALSFHFFGLQALALLLSFLAGEFFLKHWLTNRSLYSFAALTVLVSLVYHFIMMVSAFLFSYQGQSFSLLGQESFWQDMVYELIASLVAVSLIFYAVNAISRRMKSFFVK